MVSVAELVQPAAFSITTITTLLSKMVYVAKEVSKVLVVTPKF